MAAANNLFLSAVGIEAVELTAAGLLALPVQKYWRRIFFVSLFLSAVGVEAREVTATCVSICTSVYLLY